MYFIKYRKFLLKLKFEFQNVRNNFFLKNWVLPSLIKKDLKFYISFTSKDTMSVTKRDEINKKNVSVTKGEKIINGSSIIKLQP